MERTMREPMILQPMLYEKVWGGRRLERFGKALPEAKRIGESWELADLDATSASGGGGGAARSVIESGACAGMTLREAAERMGRDLLGDTPTTKTGGFPLLLKYLDAAEHLSVQVHPSPAYAAAHPESHLKTECWWVVEAEPGAVIYKGLRSGVTAEAFARHIEEGTVERDLIQVPARAGDFHSLPSGVVHALGAGVLVAEVQTPSDTTFRVFDWGRTGRELHVQQALACIDFEHDDEADAAPIRFEGTGRGELVRTEFFTVHQRNLRAGEAGTIETRGRAVAVMCVRGGVQLGSMELRAGTTALAPASIESAAIEASGQTTLLEIGLPSATARRAVPPRAGLP